MFIAVALVAINLRMTITGVGPLLDQIAADQGVPLATLGALGSIPLLAWAFFSPVAHWFSTRVGMTNAVAWSLVAMAAGTAWRSLPGGPANLWLGTALIGVGLAISNVLMPAVIKRDFPNRLPLVMGVYTSLLSGFGAVVSGLVVPVSHLPTANGELGWQLTLLLTGAPIPFAIVVWLWAQHRRRAALRAETSEADPTPSTGRIITDTGSVVTSTAGRRIWGDRLAWLVSLYMGAQSAVFYIMLTWFVSYQVSIGRSPVIAGLELAVLQLLGILGSMIVPIFAHGRWQRLAPIAAPALGLIAWIGMLIAPEAVTLWAIIGGVSGGSTFTIALTLTAQRARTQDHATALSGMAQAVGYGLAALGPVTFGWLYDVAGNWVWSFVLLWGFSIATIIVGIPAGRKRFVLEPRG